MLKTASTFEIIFDSLFDNNDNNNNNKVCRLPFWLKYFKITLKASEPQRKEVIMGEYGSYNRKEKKWNVRGDGQKWFYMY